MSNGRIIVQTKGRIVVNTAQSLSGLNSMTMSEVTAQTHKTWEFVYSGALAVSYVYPTQDKTQDVELFCKRICTSWWIIGYKIIFEPYL